MFASEIPGFLSRPTLLRALLEDRDLDREPGAGPRSVAAGGYVAAVSPGKGRSTNESGASECRRPQTGVTADRFRSLSELVWE